jgi:hypothetical protein
MTRIIGRRGLDVSDGGRRASRSRAWSSSYVNKRGSEEGLYGLKSRRIGLEWVSSRMISNVSACQRLVLERTGRERCREEFEVKEGKDTESEREDVQSLPPA